MNNYAPNSYMHLFRDKTHASVYYFLTDIWIKYKWGTKTTGLSKFNLISKTKSEILNYA